MLQTRFKQQINFKLRQWVIRSKIKKMQQYEQIKLRDTFKNNDLIVFTIAFSLSTTLFINIH